MAAAGYSGTPLAKKLGIVAGSRVLARHAPGDYAALLAPLPDGVQFAARLSTTVDVMHVFCDRRADLAEELAAARQGLRADAVLWASWPKKASKAPTDITEDMVRA